MVGQMGAEPYLLRSGFNGGLAFAQDVRPADYPRELLREGIAETKRLRPYWLGHFYPLSPVTISPTDWCVTQYHRPVEGDGVIMAFRRHRSPYNGFSAAPREIDPDARYTVTRSAGYAPGRPVEMTGAELASLSIEIDERPGSVVIHYARAG
jgi:hypothetical protein